MNKIFVVLLALCLFSLPAAASDYYVESDYNVTVPVNASANSSSYLLIELESGFTPTTDVYDMWVDTVYSADITGSDWFGPYNITYQADVVIVGTSTNKYGLTNATKADLTNSIYLELNSDGADYANAKAVVGGVADTEAYSGYTYDLNHRDLIITTNATHATLSYEGWGEEVVTPIPNKQFKFFMDETGSGGLQDQFVRKHYDNAPVATASVFDDSTMIVEISNTNNFAITDYQVTFDASMVDQTDESLNVTAYAALDVPVPTYPINNANLVYEYPPVTNAINLTWDGNGGSQYSYEVRDIGGTLIASGTTANTYGIVEIPEGSYYWTVESDLTETMETFTAYFTVSNTYITDGTTSVVGTVYEMDNFVKTPIPQAVVYISNDTFSDHETVGSDGYYSFTGLTASSTYYIKASATDYDDSEIALVTPEGGNTTVKDILLVAETKYYDSHKVEYIVQTIWGTIYPGVDVTVYKSNNINSLDSGTTGTDGAITFELDEEVEYRLTFVNSTLGIDEEITHYPQESRYNVYVERSLTDLVDVPNNRNEEINISVSGVEIDSDDAIVSISYADAMAETNSVTIYLNQSNRDDPINQTIIDSITINSDSEFVQNFTISDYSGQAYLVNLHIDHDTFGEYEDSYSVRFSGMMEDFGWSGIWLWIGIGGLVFVGGMFGQRAVPIGGLTVCVAAWVMLSIGIFDEIDTLGFRASLTFATVLAVVSYVNSRAKEEYT